MKEIGVDNTWEQREIKSEPITVNEIEQMKELSGSYESLFSRRAIKYRSLGLKDKQLSEQDYKNYILQEYTFLKRPVIIIDGELFAGNAKSTVAAVKEKLS